LSKIGDIIKIKALTKKMKDRINSYGANWVITQITNCTIQGEDYDTLLKSVDKAFKIGPNQYEEYGMWVKIDRDCEVINE